MKHGHYVYLVATGQSPLLVIVKKVDFMSHCINYVSAVAGDLFKKPYPCIGAAFKNLHQLTGFL